MQIKNLTTTPAATFILVKNTEWECPCMGSKEECSNCSPGPGDGQREVKREEENYIPSPVDPEMPF